MIIANTRSKNAPVWSKRAPVPSKRAYSLSKRAPVVSKSAYAVVIIANEGSMFGYEEMKLTYSFTGQLLGE